MQGLFGGAISHTHGAASQFPQRAVLPPRDLEVVEERRSFGLTWLLSLIQAGAQQTSKTYIFRAQRFSADRTNPGRCWSHSGGRASSLSERATVRAALHPLLIPCPPSVAPRLEASRDNAPADA